ncbi:hypothetical protein [Sphingomonas sp.]|uniref:hypothetical protein n=1 Tax=Sphingomonas sp. TaxID=28214 RepID=UPI00307D2748
MRTNEPRAIAAPHLNSEGRAMFPAGTMEVIAWAAPGEPLRPTIQMTEARGCAGLIFLPTAEELRAMAEEFIRQAQMMEQAARDLADEAIGRARR